LLAAVALLTGSPVYAGSQTVYQTIEADGSVSYSDTPPADQIATKLTVTYSSRMPTDADRQWLERIRETTDRIVSDRQSREAHRANLRKLEAEAAAARTASTAPVADYRAERTVRTSYPHWHSAHHYQYGYRHTRPFALHATDSASRPTLSEQLRRRSSTSQIYRKH